MTFAHVAVQVPARAGTLFSYSVPPDLAVSAGTMVMVPFSSRVLPGIVVRTDTQSPGIPTRQLLARVQGAPALSPERVEVAIWLAEHYRTALFDSLGLFLPPGWQRAVEQGSPGGSAATWLFRWPAGHLGDDTVLAVADPLRCAEGRARGRIASLLAERGPMPAGKIAAAGCSLATLRGLVTKGVLRIVDVGAGTPGPLDSVEGRQDTRAPSPILEQAAPGSHPRSSIPCPLALNEAQTAAYAPIVVALESRCHQVFVLHGVTGSGKTHVYFRLIEAAVRTGRRAIVLVSEIAQTPEALERYSERFPGRVALMHSALSSGQRWDMWRGVCEGRFDVVVGPRSALFAPVPDLGLIVMDEEHEPAYKQDERPPRYHAREVAIELGRRAGIPVILGSATPDVCTYHLARQGVYRLLALPERYAGPTARGTSSGLLPPVEIVDLRQELRSGNTSILSRRLQSGLARVLEGGEQAILFLNRRGSSTAVVCRDCGHVVKCGRCDVALVFHKELGSLLCHQCNRETRNPDRCPRCRSRRISYFGAGTERVEEEVRRLYPSARVKRWDHDTAARAGAHARIHEQFRRREADILVGTQMVAKALDFPLVTLVGVVLADVTLHLPDFRAAERTFQLLSQVAGRAGRGEAEGRVIFQTYSPDHYAIVAAANHDYAGFFRQEMEFRRHHSYPPFRRMVRMVFTGTGEARARYEALQMKKRLLERTAELGISDVEVMGPAPAFHARVRSRWRWQIVVAGAGASRLIGEVSLPPGWSMDVDPVSLL